MEKNGEKGGGNDKVRERETVINKIEEKEKDNTI